MPDAESTLVGAAAATSSTLAHAAGPIIALYLLPQRLDRQLFVGTCAIYFFILNTAKLPPYYFSGMFSRDWSCSLSGPSPWSCRGRLRAGSTGG